jgi:hypothetical protein
MTRPLLLTAALIVLLASCDSLSPSPSLVTIAREYRHELLSPEECENAQNNGWFINCHQVLTLCPDGRAFIMVTDIVISGRFQPLGGGVWLRFPPQPEVPRYITFQIADDGDRLIDPFGNDWTKGDSHWAIVQCNPGLIVPAAES